MSQTKRARRTFRAGVDALEGRLVLSSVGPAQGAHAVQAPHVAESRHLRVEHPVEPQIAPLQVRVARHHRQKPPAMKKPHRHAAGAIGGGSNPGSTSRITVGTLGQSSGQGSSTSSTGITVGTPGQSSGQGSSTSSTETGPGQNVHSPALTQVNQRPFRPIVSGSLTSTTSTSSSVTTGAGTTAGTTAGGVTPVFIVNDQRDVSLGARTPIVVGTNAGGLNNFTSNLAIQFIQNNGNSTGLISTTNAVSGTGATFGIAFL